MSVEVLRDFKPRNDFFVGIDSDGCAFDTMELKHKECFCPCFINVFELQSVSKYAREVWEFGNLYSRWRGANRFPEVVMCLEWLRERPEVQRRGARVPKFPALEEWIKRETKLGNPALRKAVEETGSAELAQVLRWSEAVNKAVDEMVRGVGPFPGVRETLEKLRGKADCMVVSATPEAALRKEWGEHGIDKYVALIAGQESGTKKEHLGLAARGKYAGNHILMIGDAWGDYEAAKANGALFYPINPGHEDESWARLVEEGIERFLGERYEGAYQEELVEEFKKYLPETPPWKR
ncbi:MAG: HAD hydrolase-like protein [bacterium]|nr:HAD hydrolase-like protein [bacterium]